MTTLKFIDISSHQGTIGTLGSDLTGVIIKATEGTSYVNPDLAEQVATARQDGKLIGFYHFSDVSDAAAEAKHFTDTIQQYIQPGDFAALDWETGSYSDAIDQWCATFITDVDAVYGFVPMLYSNAARINAGASSWPKTRATNAGLWEAAWGSSQPSASPWPFVAIWQNSDNGSEQGVNGAVDTDIVLMDVTALQKYGYKGGVGNTVTPNVHAATPVAAPSGGDVIVARGNSLSQIAVAHGVSLGALEAANPQISNPSLIYPGETVHLPGGSQTVQNVSNIYHVISGDTLSSIAARFGESLAAVEAKNPQIPNFNLIYAGQAVNV